jgi:hypothetical protein
MPPAWAFSWLAQEFDDYISNPKPSGYQVGPVLQYWQHPLLLVLAQRHVGRDLDLPPPV